MSAYVEAVAPDFAVAKTVLRGVSIGEFFY